MNMRRVSMLFGRYRGIQPTFYVDSRDAIDDGAGKVLSLTDRINGWSFAADSSGNRPKIDTALTGTQFILVDAINMNLIATSLTTAFGGANTPASFVMRMRRTFAQYSYGLEVGNVATGDKWMLGMASTTGVRVYRAGSIVAVGNGTYDKSTTLSTNTWYTIGFSYTPSSITFYRNGVSIGSSTSGNVTMDTIDQVTLCNNSGYSGSLRGYYAAWKGWAGTALDASQHLSQHNELSAWAA